MTTSEPQGNRWHAEVQFTGDLTDEQLVELCSPGGVAKAGNRVDNRIMLRFVLDGVTDHAVAALMTWGLLDKDPLWSYRHTGHLSSPTSVLLMDETAWQGRVNEGLGLPYDMPVEDVSRSVLLTLDRLPPATDEDRARWQER